MKPIRWLAAFGLVTLVSGCGSVEPMPETLAFEGQYTEQLGRAEYLKREHLRLVDRVETLEARNAELQGKETLATENIAAASQSIQQKQADFERAQKKKAQLEQEIPLIERSIADLDARMKKTRQEEKELAAQFQAEQARFAELEQSYQSQTSQNQQVTELLIAAGEKHKTLRGQVDQLRRSNGQLEVRLAELRGDAEALKKALAALGALEAEIGESKESTPKSDSAEKPKGDGGEKPKDDGGQEDGSSG